MARRAGDSASYPWCCPCPSPRSVPLTLAVAAAAQATGRPVRIMLDRDEDMVTLGSRHPFLGRSVLHVYSRV